MNRLSKNPGAILVVIDEIALVNTPPKYHCGAIVDVPIADVLARIPVDPARPTIHVDIQSEALMHMKRVDGQTKPIVIEVDQDSCNSMFRVDHTGMTPI